MIDSIHQSSLGMAFRCGEQFRRRYMEGEIIPPGVAAGRGTALHKANEVNLKQKVKTKSDLPLSDLEDACRDGFVKAFNHGVYLCKEERGEKDSLLNEALNDSLRLTGLYRREVAPEIQPLEVEREFNIDVGMELPLAGKIDIEQNGKVDDLKTATKSWSEGRIDHEIQPVMYSLAHERETGIRPEFRYHILVALKTGEKRQIQSLTVTEQHYRALFAKIATFMNMLKLGLFPPANPSSWWCGSDKWCGYYATCPYMGNSLPKREV